MTSPRKPFAEPIGARPATVAAARWAVLVAIAAMLSACPAPTARAWNHIGHRVSALIAWREMSPPARAAAARLLRAHPRYEQDLMRDMPAGHADPDAWAFATAAYWPDIVRDRRHPMYATHHKSPWHYVDYAYAPDGDRRGYRDGEAEWRPGTEPANVLQAVPKVLADLRDPGLSDADRAIALCWYLHLVGDLHQPLHALSLVNADFPAGDRGGNSVLVRDRAGVINLHAYWDNRLGRHAEPAALARTADRATEDHPRDDLGDEARPAAPDAVARESRALAVAYAHLHGALRYAAAPTAAEGEPLPPPPPADSVPPLPSGYDAAAAGVARRRVAQAGYRMGEELSRLLDRAYVPRLATGTAPAATGPATRPDSELLVPRPDRLPLGQ